MEGVISDQVTAGIITSPPVEPLHCWPPSRSWVPKKHTRMFHPSTRANTFLTETIMVDQQLLTHRCILVQTHHGWRHVPIWVVQNSPCHTLFFCVLDVFLAFEWFIFVFNTWCDAALCPLRLGAISCNVVVKPLKAATMCPDWGQSSWETTRLGCSLHWLLADSAGCHSIQICDLTNELSRCKLGCEWWQGHLEHSDGRYRLHASLNSAN